MSNQECKKDIFEFINANNYQIILGPWFKDIWFPLFEDKSVIITNEILGFIYKDTIDSIDLHNLKSNYKKFLIKNEIEFDTLKYYKNIVIDYPYLESEIILCDYNNLIQKTWLKLTTSAFKESIMLINHNNSKELRRYYIIIEKILLDYSKYIYNFNNNQMELDFKTKLSLKEKENEILKLKATVINDMFLQKGNIQRNQIFYIATTKLYSVQNVFKIGGLENKNYNKHKDNNYYLVAVFECHDYRLVEHFISSFLFNFKITNKKDLFKINYDDLFDISKKIINHLDEYISYFNCIQYKLIDNLINTKEVKEDLKIINYENGIWLSSKNIKMSSNLIEPI